MRTLRLIFLMASIGILLGALSLFFSYQQKKHAVGNRPASNLAQAEELTLTEHDQKHGTSYTLHAKQALVPDAEQTIICKQATLQIAKETRITATIVIAQAEINRSKKEILCSQNISGTFEGIGFTTTSCAYNINTHELTAPAAILLTSKNMQSAVCQGIINMKNGSFEGSGGIKTTIIF